MYGSKALFPIFQAMLRLSSEKEIIGISFFKWFSRLSSLYLTTQQSGKSRVKTFCKHIWPSSLDLNCLGGKDQKVLKDSFHIKANMYNETKQKKTRSNVLEKKNSGEIVQGWSRTRQQQWVNESGLKSRILISQLKS